MYNKYWNQDNYQKTYKQIFRYGLKYQTKSRHIKTSLYGSTIGPTRYPQFIFRDSYRILPRPYRTFLPNSNGWKHLQSTWFIEFITDIEKVVIQYFMYTYPNIKERKVISYMITKAKKVIPSSCRICDTFFTHMGIIGNLNSENNEVSKHVDKEDYITVLFHIGFPTKGGETNYYSGLTSKNFGKLEQQIKCEHGRITIGRFDKIVHSAESWVGQRGCINFNLKKKVLEHFLKHGTKFYSQFEINNFPSGPFFAC